MLFIVLSAAHAQYSHNNGGYQPNFSTQQPPVNILLHKQALGTDGSFKFAFAADNGLQQGEAIDPDGTRRGSYSYVDPSGKTITLSYTAGKDGFRVLSGDHIPKAPPVPQQRPQEAYYQQPQPQEQYSNNGIPYDAYKPSPTYNGNYQDDSSHHGQYTQPAPVTHYQQPQRQYSVQEGTYEKPSRYVAEQYQEPAVDPRKPHSFGSGYAFEFAG